MSKVGIYKIGFVVQNEENDQWVLQEEQQRALPAIYIDGLRMFNSIDQRASSLSEDLVIDESGGFYKILLKFVVRKDEDIELAKKYSGRPVSMYVWAVDGKRYKIGTKSYPSWMVTSNVYKFIETREIAIDVEYKSKASLLR